MFLYFYLYLLLLFTFSFLPDKLFFICRQVAIKSPVHVAGQLYVTTTDIDAEKSPVFKSVPEILSTTAV